MPHQGISFVFDSFATKQEPIEQGNYTMSVPDNNTSQRNQNYRTCIHFYILYDLDLNANHLRFYGQIEQLESNPNPKVKASFSYDWMAKQLGIDRRNVMRVAQLLKNKGYITHTQLPNGQWVWATKKDQIIEEGGVALDDTPPVTNFTTPGVTPSATQNTQKINTQKLKNSNIAQENVSQQTNGKLSVIPWRNTLYPLSAEDLMTMDNFEHFWSIYPRQKNKGQAALQWAASKCEANAYEIIENLIAQIKYDSDFMKFPPMPANYIRDKRWLDQIDKKKHISKTDKISQRDINMHSTDWIKPMIKPQTA
jgi:hypothetical protein